MVDTSQKIPFNQSINEFVTTKVRELIHQTGRSLPCSVVSVSGAIVTVKFEVTDDVFTIPNVTMPLFGPEYIRYPIQPGDKGVALAADAYLGGMSGLGGGVASLTQQGNLGTLVFFPIGNKNWTKVDPKAVTIYGPNGVVMRDTSSKSMIVLVPDSITATGQTFVEVIVGPTSLTVSASGVTIIGNLTVSGNMTITGTGAGSTITVNGSIAASGNLTAGTSGAPVDLLHHTHTNSGGTGTGGPPTPGS
jgi:hypothetical protein